MAGARISHFESWHLEGDGISKETLIQQLQALPDDVIIEIDGTLVLQRQEAPRA